MEILRPVDTGQVIDREADFHQEVRERLSLRDGSTGWLHGSNGMAADLSLVVRSDGRKFGLARENSQPAILRDGVFSVATPKSLVPFP